MSYLCKILPTFTVLNNTLIGYSDASPPGEHILTKL